MDGLFLKLRKINECHFVKHCPAVSSQALVLVFIVRFKYTIGQSFAWMHSPTSHQEVFFWWIVYCQQAHLVAYGNSLKKKIKRATWVTNQWQNCFIFHRQYKSIELIARNKDNRWFFFSYLLRNDNWVSKERDINSHILLCVVMSMATEMMEFWKKQL